MEVKFLVAGDKAVSVVFGEEISLEVNRRVSALFEELERRPIKGVIECSPCYASLTVHYDPMFICFEALVETLRARVSAMRETEVKTKRIKYIPILYGTELGPDLEYIAELENTSVDEVIRKHSEHEYYVYMLGFSPGHPYMARFEEPYGFKRRSQPRVSIPARSVVVQLNLSDFIPFEQPCGWNIIGSTPLELYDGKKENPFLLEAGDWVKHVPVAQEEYEMIRAQVLAGIYVLRTEEVSS